MPAVVIRHALPSDLAAIRDCLVETWHSTYDQIYGIEEVTRITDSWHAINVLQSQLQKAGNVCLVAEIDGQLCGTSLLELKSLQSATLLRLYVRPTYQRQSIGLTLLLETLKAVPPSATVQLQVARPNSLAAKFYEKNGFVRVEEDASSDSFVYQASAQSVIQRSPT